MSEADIRDERIKKIDILKASGMEPYPAETARDTTIGDFNADFGKLETDEKTITIAGRVMSLRGQGGIIFADLFDGSISLTTGGPARAQIVLQSDTAAQI